MNTYLPLIQPQVILKNFSGREITFGTALGDMLHHRRQQPSHSDESVLQALSEKVKREGRRTPSPDSARSKSGAKSDNEKKVGKVNIGAAAAQGWIWWGKPLWHDLGYVAVC